MTTTEQSAADQTPTTPNPAGRITTPFGFASTAAEVITGIDLHGKHTIVTGGASGIGVETVRALATAGAHVTIAARKLDVATKVAAEITAGTGNPNIDVRFLELADQASIASFVAGWDGPLHILINNAGVMACPLARNANGWEMQFATNHLGHFALTTGLHDALAAADGARVVGVSSSAHMRSPVIFEDVQFLERKYTPWGAYGQSKTANVLFGVEASKRWADDGITVNALNPGGIRTALQRYVSEEDLADMRRRAGAETNWKTPEQGASTSITLATYPALEGIGGRYFENCNEALPNVPGTNVGVAAYALDPEAAERLWALSVETIAS